jgi:septal ring factor EnvC (AmiA/AmiB activator)
MGKETQLDFEIFFKDFDVPPDLNPLAYIDYTEHKLRYLTQTRQARKRFKDLIAAIEKIHENVVMTDDRVLYRYTDMDEYTRLQKLYKNVITEQVKRLADFEAFLSRINELGDMYSKAERRTSKSLQRQSR